jgi:hypothetical protein
MKVLSKLILVFVVGNVGLFGQAPDTVLRQCFGKIINNSKGGLK